MVKELKVLALCFSVYGSPKYTLFDSHTNAFKHYTPA